VIGQAEERDNLRDSTLADLLAIFAEAEREGALRDKIRFLYRCSLLVVDEIGYLPVTSAAATCSSKVLQESPRR
jgi:DNA replication protein DnaC